MEKVFIPSVADKVKNLCELREQKGYSYQIQVDGSINDQTAIVCKKAGADIFCFRKLYIWRKYRRTNSQDYGCRRRDVKVKEN